MGSGLGIFSNVSSFWAMGVVSLTVWYPALESFIRAGGQWPRVGELDTAGGWVWTLDWLVCI